MIIKETYDLLAELDMNEILEYVEAQGYQITVNEDMDAEQLTDEASRQLYNCQEGGLLKEALCKYLGIMQCCSADIVSDMIRNKIK